ncbi:MAG: HEAT repeat domain-containing protein [Gemmatimonadetes bacterium]|nr:HEAT repeat domain-containing protein [Gemmatimonadota bacterium]
MATTRLATTLSRAARLALLPVALLSPRALRAQGAAQAAPVPATSATDQERVRQVLAHPYGSQEFQSGIQELRVSLGTIVFDYLALDAGDPDLPAMQRANALLALRDLGVVRLGTFKAGYDAPDPAVRAAAVAALRIALDDPKTYAGAVAVLTRALQDPDRRVQAKALESLGDHEAPALRRFLAGGPPAELRTVAEQLLRAAEERGAPLEPVDSTGALAHTSLSGVRVSFKPTRRWPEWNAAAGELSVTPVKGKPVVVASNVEVVANVLPVAVAPDGRYLAYEAGRTIHVRDLRKGTDRVLGPGIAPRAAPLAYGFIYLVQRPQTHREVQADPLEYDVHYVGYAGGDDRTLGVLKATARTSVNGNASPARWMRIVEGRGSFEIVGDNIVTFELPNLAAGPGPVS